MRSTFILLAAAAIAAVGQASLLGDLFFMSRDSGKLFNASYVCPGPDFHCGDCGTVVNCVPKIGGGYEAIVDTNCTASGRYCNEMLAECTDQFTDKCNPTVSEFVATCTGEGYFPHPFKCDTFYYCSAADAVPAAKTCDQGYAYDVRTMACSRRLADVNNTCTAVAKPCTGAGRFPVAGNTRLYYDCLKKDDAYQPQFSYCPRSLKLIGGRCADPTTYSDGLSAGKCKAKGNYYVPNCRQYNECTAFNVTATLRTCIAGTIFDPIKQLCVGAECEI